MESAKTSPTYVTFELSEEKRFEKLMEKHRLLDKNLIYGSWEGDKKSLRKYAVDLFGLEKVGTLTDGELGELFRKNGYIPVNLSTKDTNRTYIMKIDDLDKCLWLDNV